MLRAKPKSDLKKRMLMRMEYSDVWRLKGLGIRWTWYSSGVGMSYFISYASHTVCLDLFVAWAVCPHLTHHPYIFFLLAICAFVEAIPGDPFDSNIFNDVSVWEPKIASFTISSVLYFVTDTRSYMLEFSNLLLNDRISSPTNSSTVVAANPWQQYAKASTSNDVTSASKFSLTEHYKGSICNCHDTKTQGNWPVGGFQNTFLGAVYGRSKFRSSSGSWVGCLERFSICSFQLWRCCIKEINSRNMLKWKKELQ